MNIFRSQKQNIAAQGILSTLKDGSKTRQELIATAKSYGLFEGESGGVIARLFNEGIIDRPEHGIYASKSTQKEPTMIDIDATDILRNLPEAFWDIATWNQDGTLAGNNVTIDVADRRRIVEKVIGMAWAHERNTEEPAGRLRILIDDNKKITGWERDNYRCDVCDGEDGATPQPDCDICAKKGRLKPCPECNGSGSDLS